MSLLEDISFIESKNCVGLVVISGQVLKLKQLAESTRDSKESNDW